MIKGSTQQQDTTFVNIYTHNVGTPTHKKQILMDRERETNTKIVMVETLTPHCYQRVHHQDRKSSNWGKCRTTVIEQQ